MQGEFPTSFLVTRVTPGYFETMGIPVVEGRSFTTDDHNLRLGSLIISQSLKDRYWPDGVISYIVSQRTSEIGVRLALGADSKKVGRMILMQGMRLAGAGVVIGLMTSAAMGGLLTSLLYGVTPFDPLTLGAGSVIFLAVAALAAIIPALKASRIPPAVALQST